MQLALWLLLSSAHATEVLWTSEPTAEQRAEVARQAGATGEPLSAIDLVGVPEASIDNGYQALEQALTQVRAYESKFEGELIILADLEQPIANIEVIRDETDRGKVFAALAYQGFAANRYWGEGLKDDEKAAPYRTEIDGQVFETAWLDAAAIEPARKVTPYEVAEAPQRVALEGVQKRSEQLLPGGISLKGLEDGDQVVLDGRKTDIPATGTLRVAPGRHWIHVVRDGRIIDPTVVRLQPAQTETLEIGASVATANTWLASLSGKPPEPVRESLEALGGSLWVVTPGDPLQIRSVTAEGITTTVTLGKPESDTPTPDDVGPVSLAVTVGSGWMYDGNFYTSQADVAPHSTATVNAASVGGTVEFRYTAGLFAVSAGADVHATLGLHHTSVTGDGATRLRPYPFVAAGLPWLQLGGGYQFPHHPAVGVRSTIPLASSLGLAANVTAGLPGSVERADTTVWDREATLHAWGGVSWRFGG